MSAPLLILVLTISSGEPEGALGVMSDAARGALGDEARIVIENRDAPLSDADAIALGERTHADAVVELLWTDPSRANLHLHEYGRPGWVDRELVFAPGDDILERGRTIGLALGSMIVPVPSGSAAPPAAPQHDTSPTAPPAAPTPIPSWLVVDVAARGTAAVTSNAPSVGVVVGIGWIPLRTLALRAITGVRTGGVADTQVTTVALGAGIAWHPLVSRWAHFGGRLDFLVLRDDVRGPPGSADSTAHRGRWVPAVAGFVDVEWLVAARSALTIAVGSEVAFGTARVLVGDQLVARLPPVRLAAEVGYRIRF